MHKILFILLALALLSCAFWQPYKIFEPTATPSPKVPPVALLTPTPEKCNWLHFCTVTANTLNLRAGPGTSYQVIEWLRAGDVVTILQAGPWAHVQAGDLQGYINSNYCKIGE